MVVTVNPHDVRALRHHSSLAQFVPASIQGMRGANDDLC